MGWFLNFIYCFIGVMFVCLVWVMIQYFTHGKKKKMTMKKEYTEYDGIELRLVHYAGPYYELQWRYREPHKFLCFNIKDKWKSINLYTWTSDPEDNPYDWLYWSKVTFNLGNKSEAQEYESLRSRIKTKKALFDYYNVESRLARFHEDVKRYEEWAETLKVNAKKYVK